MPRASTAIDVENGVYRTPGRVAPDAPIPPPSRSALFSPLARGIGWVLALLAPPFLFNVLLAEPLFHVSRELRFRPGLESIQDVLAVLLVASLPIMIHRIVRRVRPEWGGLRRRTRIVYVAALVLAQTSALLGAELALMESRGGFPFFEPHLRTTASASDARTAYLFAGGLFCHYEVFVADPYALTMHRKLSISRTSCQEATPRVQWNDDGTIGLVDSAGKPVESQTGTWGWWWLGGGC